MTDDILGIYHYYGLHQPYFEDGVNHVFAKYDVVAMRVAFGVVNDSLRSSVQLNNKHLFEVLSKAYPGFTENCYSRKCGSVYRRRLFFWKRII